MGINHHEPIRPGYLPSDPEIRGLVGRRNRAFRDAQHAVGMADWADANYEGSAADAAANRGYAVGRMQEVVQLDEMLDGLGYDPDDFRWGQPPHLR